MKLFILTSWIWPVKASPCYFQWLIQDLKKKIPCLKTARVQVHYFSKENFTCKISLMSTINRHFVRICMIVQSTLYDYIGHEAAPRELLFSDFLRVIQVNNNNCLQNQKFRSKFVFILKVSQKVKLRYFQHHSFLICFSPLEGPLLSMH